MRVLVLGGDGMLGHQLVQVLRSRSHEVGITLRRDLADYVGLGLFETTRIFAGLDLRRHERLSEVFAEYKPQAVVNCVGLVKQRDDAEAAIPNLEINALLPHRLAALCALAGARLVHISTDCVFSGRAGMYRETDKPDAEDLYGRSKLLGEVTHEPHCITIRTSMIGRELSRKTGLLEWFLAQTGTIRGYRRAIFSGLTTIELSRIIERILVSHPHAHGLWHVSSAPIDKHSLLALLRNRLQSAVEIVPDETVTIDRSLDSTRFRREFSYQPPSWPTMIEEL